MTDVLLWRPDEHEGLTNRAWEEAHARRAIAAIVADAEDAATGKRTRAAALTDGAWPGHPLDDLGIDESPCSLYLGAAGVIWGLWKLGSAFDGSAALTAALHRYRAVPDFGAQRTLPVC